MKIYQIENSMNNGPFKRGLPYPYSKNWKTKLPQIDGIKMNLQLYCGCKSIADLKSWFPSNNYSALLFFGFNAYEMEVDNKHVKICPTTRQVVFKRSGIRKKVNISLY
jgi:hypothetical protein